jgi:hypothetical protein
MTSFSELVPDEWYISIVCLCGERLLLCRDLTEGKGCIDGGFEITCPACDSRGTYPAEHFHYESETRDIAKVLCRAS